jgi:metal-responsive CopG/Arc/MetJ family transcriptional regulator
MKRVTITAEESLHARMDQKAKELRRSRSSVFVEAAEKFLENHQPQPKPAEKRYPYRGQR